jgi:hypothetical protein
MHRLSSHISQRETVQTLPNEAMMLIIQFSEGDQTSSQEAAPVAPFLFSRLQNTCFTIFQQRQPSQQTLPSLSAAPAAIEEEQSLSCRNNTSS